MMVNKNRGIGGSGHRLIGSSKNWSVGFRLSAFGQQGSRLSEGKDFWVDGRPENARLYSPMSGCTMALLN
jgi:hypothetical protein